MLAMSARVSPWRARVAFSSSARETAMVPSSRLRLTFGWNVWTSSPFGPFTRRVRPSIVTSTPCGIFTGSRPIRLMPLPHRSSCLSPDEGEDFPAQSFSLGLAPGHETGRRRDDRDAEPAEDARHLGLARVNAKPRLADAA